MEENLINQLISVSKLYYINGLTQEEIAKKSIFIEAKSAEC